MPEAAPDPASPMKCSDPMLLANREAPTYSGDNLIQMMFNDLTTHVPESNACSSTPRSSRQQFPSYSSRSTKKEIAG